MYKDQDAMQQRIKAELKDRKKNEINFLDLVLHPPTN